MRANVTTVLRIEWCGKGWHLPIAYSPVTPTHAQHGSHVWQRHGGVGGGRRRGLGLRDLAGGPRALVVYGCAGDQANAVGAVQALCFCYRIFLRRGHNLVMRYKVPNGQGLQHTHLHTHTHTHTRSHTRRCGLQNAGDVPWALVTGASDGIGKAFAEQLAKQVRTSHGTIGFGRVLKACVCVCARACVCVRVHVQGFHLCLVSRTEAKLAKVAEEIKVRHPSPAPPLSQCQWPCCIAVLVAGRPSTLPASAGLCRLIWRLPSWRKPLRCCKRPRQTSIWRLSSTTPVRALWPFSSSSLPALFSPLPSPSPFPPSLVFTLWANACFVLTRSPGSAAFPQRLDKLDADDIAASEACIGVNITGFTAVLMYAAGARQGKRRVQPLSPCNGNLRCFPL